MRQIHPPSSYSHTAATAVPRAVVTASAPTGITVDLRDLPSPRHPSVTEQQRLRHQLTEVRRAMDTLMEEISRLVDRREALKARLQLLEGRPAGLTPGEDGSVVAWGFFDDDL